jgi:hypothetical protein
VSNLCSDPFWGVRKACAEVIHPLAQVCSRESRWNILSPCMIQLLQDQSRWVKTAALRVLGYFISTFARSNNDNEENEGEKTPTQSMSNEEIDRLCENVDQSIKLNDNDVFNDFNFWREPTSMNVDFEDEINNNQCKYILLGRNFI